MEAKDAPPETTSWSTYLYEELVAEDLASTEAGPIANTDTLRALYRFHRLDRHYADEIERITKAAKEMVQQLEKKRAALHFFHGHSTQAIAKEMLTGSKYRSIKTPFGRIGFRRVPAHLVIEDELAILEAWKDGRLPAECVQQKFVEHPVKMELDKLYQEHGEIPPGCQLKPEEDRFYVA